jgi:hypothetical protein
MIAIGKPIHELQLDCRGHVDIDKIRRTCTISAGDMKASDAGIPSAKIQLRDRLVVTEHAARVFVDREYGHVNEWTFAKNGYVFLSKGFIEDAYYPQKYDDIRLIVESL